MTDFYDLIDTDDLSDDEEERLRRTHDLLLRVGPPPDLPAGLLQPPSERGEAAVAAAAFGGGYLFGNSNTSGTFASVRSVPMHAVGGAGTQAVGLVKVGHI